MSVAAPNSIESQELLFKVLGRLRIFESQPQLFRSAASLVASAPRYGFIFVGTPRGFQVLQSNKIAELGLSSRIVSSEYPRRDFILNATPSHLSVSCDQTHLVVGLMQDGCATGYVYDVTKFCSKTIPIINIIRLATTPGCVILDLHFNPGIPKILAACTSDGAVGVYEIKDSSIDVNTLPPATMATCLCWSPKGKQLVIGDKKGFLTQYKPDLKPVKNFSPPQDKQSWSIVNLLWVSNYQFVAVYADSSHPEERPCIMVVNVPKGGPISYINYEDICYSAGELRPPQYYMILQATWNLLMVSSANSVEVGVLALTQDQVSWQQWTQEDSARAELPFTADHQETFPLGMTLDTSSTWQLPWGENQSLQPMPLLHILSHDGVLCIYHVINIRPGAAGICSPPQALADTSGLDQFLFQAALPPAQPPQPIIQSSEATPKPTGPALLPAVSSFQQQPSGAQLFNPPTCSSLGLFATPTTLSAAGTLSSSGFSVGSFSAGSGDKIQKPTGIFPTSTAPVSFQTPQASTPILSTPAGDQLPAPQVTLAPKALAPLIPVPPVQSSEPTLQHKETVKQEESTGAAEGVDAKGETVDPEVYLKFIQGDIRAFEDELFKLQQRVSQGFIPIGLDQEKGRLSSELDALEQFVQELKETTKGQSSEITSLQSLMMESYSWMEDARSRQQQLCEPSYLQLVRAQELDPASKRHMSSIQHMQYYLESQLHEVDRHLDKQWSEFQDSMRDDSKNRLYIPTREELYQTMVKQNKILARQQCILDDVTCRIASRKLRNSNRIPLISDSALSSRSTARLKNRSEAVKNNLKSETDLSSLAENLLEMKLRNRQSENCDLDNIIDMAKNLNISRFRNVLASQKRLVQKKENALRERLMQLPMVHIKPDRIPSEMQTVGERPSVSFISAVLPISRKVKKIDHPSADTQLTKGSRSPVVETQKPSTTPNLASQGQPSLINLNLFSGKPVSPLPSNEKDAVSQQTHKPSGAMQTHPPQAPNNVAQRGNQNTVVSQTTVPSAAKSETPSISVKANIMPPSPTFVKSDVGKPEAARPVMLTPIKSDPGSVFKAPPSINAQAFTSVSSTPKSGGKPTFSGFAFPSPSKTGPLITPTTTEGSKSPLVSLGNLVDNFSQPEHPQLKTPSEAAPLIPNASTAFTASVASKPSDGAAKTSAFSFQGSNVFSPPPAFSGSGFGIPSSKPGLLPTPTKATTPSLFTPSVTIGGVTITPVSVTTSSSSFSAPPTPVKPAAPAPITVPAIVAPSSSATPPPPAPTVAPADSSSTLFGGMGLGGSPVATNKTPASIFGGTGAAAAFKPAGGSSLFGPPPTGSATSTTSTASPSKSLFGTPASTAAASSFSFSSSSLFGGTPGAVSSSLSPASTASTVVVAPLFGPGVTTSVASPASVTSPSAVFGQVTATSSAAPTVSSSTTFGQVTVTSSASPVLPTSSSVGFAPASSTTAAASPASVFGQQPVTSSPAPASSASSPDSAFGQGMTTTASSTTSVFGQPPATSATALASAANSISALFGQALTTSAAAASTTTPGSLFGQPATAAVTSAPATSSFSFSTPAATSSSSVFGGAPSTTFSFATPSSTAATTTPSSTSFTFALPASTAANTDAAGAVSTTKSFSFATSSASQPVFGSTSTAPFGQPATSTPAATSGSFFGQQICSPTSTGQSPSIFGGGSTAGPTAGFSQPATTTQSVFAQTPSAGAFGSKSAFGQSGGSLFGSSSGSTGFSASGTSMFGGGQSTGTNLFGGNATASPTSNPFQQAAAPAQGSVFGSPSPSSGSFSGGIGGTIGQTGFGSPPSFQQQSQFAGFGSSSPGFGSPPAFGSTPAFGSSATFGGAPTFGSPTKGFGSSPPPAFGSTSPTQSNSTFEALATQDSGMTFGNLAQSGQQTPQSTNVFGTATPPTFGNTGPSFGGKSFSSWR